MLFKRFVNKFFKNRKIGHNLICYRPCAINISKDSVIEIKKILYFNINWDVQRIFNNVLPGQFTLLENSSLFVDDFRISSGCRLTVNKGAKLTLGSGSINYGSSIECFNEIEIGHDVEISENVFIRDSNNHTIIYDGYKKTAPIKIGNHVWIGMNCIILPGVTIGDGCMIGAGSVVNRDIPKNSLACGVPAKVVKQIHWEK